MILSPKVLNILVTFHTQIRNTLEIQRLKENSKINNAMVYVILFWLGATSSWLNRTQNQLDFFNCYKKFKISKSMLCII